MSRYQEHSLKRFDAYEIRMVAEFGLYADGSEVIPLSECPEDLISDAARIFWSLYGWRDGEGVECIADRQCYADIRALYFAITGVDCGGCEQDHFKLPRGH
jgi:hypothetical protein